MAYRYPDHGDRLTQRMILTLSDPDSWDAEENEILELLREEVERLDSPRSLLDVGAGTGRLAWYFADLVSAVDLLEPDEGRARVARSFSGTLGPLLQIGVYTVEGELPDRDYDLVLLSHVIQHVAPAEADRLIGSCASRCRPGGIFYIATVLATTDNAAPEYRISSCNRDEPFHEDTVDRDRFIEELRHPRRDHLPVRAFGLSELETLLRGFDVEDLTVRPFHRTHAAAGNKRDTDSFRDVAVIGRKLSEVSP
jgi:SAM-dependent methyltransferase